MGSTLNFIKRNGRSGFRSAKRYSSSKTYSSFSNNKSRPKGNVENLYYKYIKLAKESSAAGDRIQAEYYYQFADHYSRNIIDIGNKSNENENISETSNKKNADNSILESSLDNSQETNKLSTENDEKSSKKINIIKQNDDSENSLNTVSFISQPAKKTTKPKK